MALYDFQCAACGKVFEVERPLGSSAKEKCPHCGSMRTTKMFSAAGIVFKGSGFYVTDSKKSSDSASGGLSGRDIKGGSDKGEGSAGKEESDSGGSGDKPAPAESSKDSGSKDGSKSSKPDSPAA